MSEIVTERSKGILRVQFNRPEEKNALTMNSSRTQVEAAVKGENQEFASRVLSADAREAIAAFFEKRRPDFNRTKSPTAVTQ